MGFKSALFGLKNEQLKKDYHIAFVTMAHNYTMHQLIFFGISLLTYSLCDYLIHQHLPSSLILLAGVIDLFLLTVFIHYYDFHKYADYIVMFFVGFAGSTFVMVAYPVIFLYFFSLFFFYFIFFFYIIL